jgi:GNAT superfamily N-acetyltransferase
MAPRSLSSASDRSSSSWIGFTWQTSDLPPLDDSAFPDLIRLANREEAEEVLQVLLSSMAMDSGWNNSLARVKPYLRGAIARLFNEGDPLCLVIPKGRRFVAASLLDPDPAAAFHLVSGPAVLMEYRNRGIGTRLLHSSLCALRDRGVTMVNGITRANTTACRHIYPKFRGMAEVLQFDPSSAMSGGNKAKA